MFKELNTKEGQTYKAWVQLDFDKKDKHNNHEVKQFHENYGFDIKAAASKFPIMELTDNEKSKTLVANKKDVNSVLHPIGSFPHLHLSGVVSTVSKNH